MPHGHEKRHKCQMHRKVAKHHYNNVQRFGVLFNMNIKVFTTMHGAVRTLIRSTNLVHAFTAQLVIERGLCSVLFAASITHTKGRCVSRSWLSLLSRAPLGTSCIATRNLEASTYGTENARDVSCDIGDNEFGVFGSKFADVLFGIEISSG